MEFEDYKYNDKPIKLWKVIKPTDLNLFRSIVSSPFKFVQFHIKTSKGLSKSSKEEALLLWGQAEEFFNSANSMSAYSKPLSSYYCILNAVKTLLVVRNISFRPWHGVFGKTKASKQWLLKNEQLTIEKDKIAGAFYKYLDNSHNLQVTYNLQELFYNLPFTHRAYLQIYKNQDDLFLPVESPRFSKINGEIKLTAKCLSENLTFKQKMGNFTRGNPDFNLVKSVLSKGDYLVSSAICSDKLSSSQINKNILTAYPNLRSSFVFIEGEKTLWYFRKSIASKPARNRIPLPITIFAISHKLSELSRYSPLRLKHHLESQHGWMLHEFIENSLEQFIAYISCEICSKELAKPRLR